MKTALFVAVLCSLVLASAPTAQPASTAAPASPSFSKFVDDYFDARFAYLPSQGTDAGFHQYDTKLEDRSRPRIESRIVELRTFLARLQAMDRSKLSFDDAIDAEALEGQIRSSLLDQDTIRNWQRNPMGYAGLPGGSADSLIKRNFAPPAERLRSLVVR
jgi:uncharacterized protein (DUF885 family)